MGGEVARRPSWRRRGGRSASGESAPWPMCWRQDDRRGSRALCDELSARRVLAASLCCGRALAARSCAVWVRPLAGGEALAGGEVVRAGPACGCRWQRRRLDRGRADWPVSVRFAGGRTLVVLPSAGERGRTGGSVRGLWLRAGVRGGGVAVGWVRASQPAGPQPRMHHTASARPCQGSCGDCPAVRVPMSAGDVAVGWVRGRASRVMHARLCDRRGSLCGRLALSVGGLCD